MNIIKMKRSQIKDSLQLNFMEISDYTCTIILKKYFLTKFKAIHQLNANDQANSEQDIRKMHHSFSNMMCIK